MLILYKKKVIKIFYQSFFFSNPYTYFRITEHTICQNKHLLPGILIGVSNVFQCIWPKRKIGILYFIFYSNPSGPQLLIKTKVQFACAKKYTRVNILRCVFILRCANQPESKFKLRSHGFYLQEYFCR